MLNQLAPSLATPPESHSPSSGIIGLAFASMALSAHASPSRYAVGQVWEYKTRSQDAGSTLKIQQIETLAGRNVYHISVIGVHLATPGFGGTLPHLPVSDVTLDASVTRLSASNVPFPSVAVQEGIAAWRKATGGVYTISVFQIIDIVDDMTGRGSKQREEAPAIS